MIAACARVAAAAALVIAGARFAEAQSPSPGASPSWLQIGGEFRERVEGARSLGFVDGRDDLYWLSRFRVDAAVVPSKRFLFTTQLQDARVARKQVGVTGAPFAGTLDVRTASVAVGDAAGTVVVRAGRQELAFGEQRLVGHVSWLNTARTFDAVRVSVRRGRFRADAFGSSVVRVVPGAFDRSGHGNRFFGVDVAADNVGPVSTVEPYVFWRGDRRLAAESGGVGDLGAATIGVRVSGPLPSPLSVLSVGLDYGIEMAWQHGSLGGDTVRAWAGHWQLRTRPAGRLAVRVTSEYNYASGDANPTDGVRGGFDQLYPTPHDKYGLADQVGWRNLHHARGAVELSPVRRLTLLAGYHSWWRAEQADGLYAASGALLVPGSPNGRHIGQEIDLQVSGNISRLVSVAAGYARILPGAFLQRATQGSPHDYVFLMTTCALRPK